MRRRRRNRATWFPILGFDMGANGANGQGLSTVDIRTQLTNPNGSASILVIPIIPDIDVPPEQIQTQSASLGPFTGATLRDYVEGQSCVIERIVGNIVCSTRESDPTGSVIACAAVAVLPAADDGSGNFAISDAELDPLRADNSAQPWLWRRVWVLGGRVPGTGFPSTGDPFSQGLPTNNLYGSVAEGSKIDTKGTKRAIRREQRIALIYSILNSFADVEGPVMEVIWHTDLRVIGRMTRARNRSQFK